MNRRKFKKRRENLKQLLTNETRRATEVDISWAQLHREMISGDLSRHRGQQRR